MEENKKQKKGEEHDLALYLRHFYLGSPRMTWDMFICSELTNIILLWFRKGLLMRSWNDKVALERTNAEISHYTELHWPYLQTC